MNNEDIDKIITVECRPVSKICSQCGCSCSRTNWIYPTLGDISIKKDSGSLLVEKIGDSEEMFSFIQIVFIGQLYEFVFERGQDDFFCKELVEQVDHFLQSFSSPPSAKPFIKSSIIKQKNDESLDVKLLKKQVKSIIANIMHHGCSRSLNICVRFVDDKIPLLFCEFFEVNEE